MTSFPNKQILPPYNAFPITLCCSVIHDLLLLDAMQSFEGHIGLLAISQPSPYLPIREPLQDKIVLKAKIIKFLVREKGQARFMVL